MITRDPLRTEGAPGTAERRAGDGGPRDGAPGGAPGRGPSVAQHADADADAGVDPPLSRLRLWPSYSAALPAQDPTRNTRRQTGDVRQATDIAGFARPRVGGDSAHPPLCSNFADSLGDGKQRGGKIPDAC